MSCNRENVIWQSKDGTWSRAFYEFWTVNEDSDDFDSEWDVEYGDNFNWVSVGHPSEDAAERSWKGANPGGWTVVGYSPATASQCDALDAKAKAFRETRRMGRCA